MADLPASDVPRGRGARQKPAARAAAAESADISTAELRVVAEQDKRIAALAPPGILIAIVAPHDHGFGLARMWEVFVEGTGWETMSFRSRSDAEVWLREQVKRKTGLDLPDEPGTASG